MFFQRSTKSHSKDQSPLHRHRCVPGFERLETRDVPAHVAAAPLAVFPILGPAVVQQEVPFKGNANAIVTSVVPAEDGLHMTLTATGQATHLGRYTREESIVIHPDGSIEGSVVFVAANGDRLFADFNGGFISPTTIAGTYHFTGGTGRFEDATGSADFSGVTTDFVHAAITFSGSIAF